METLSAFLVAAGFGALFVGLLWGITRGAGRYPLAERCATCAEKPVCETGALAGWLSTRRCPNLEKR
ncbi:MAG: hypothetical protein K0R40_3970 [Burkholderiales bacterium]|jgi:hypothetical protein|nr:hypothetical protein [Burkholderiales bacterium]